MSNMVVLGPRCRLLSDVILSAQNLQGFKDFFKFVVFAVKEWCFIIWLNTAYYTTKVSVINTQSSIYNKFARILCILIPKHDK